MLKESAVEKVCCAFSIEPQLQRGESVIFFKNKSGFRELQPVCSQVHCI